MATHSSILAWRIPETAEPGRLQSMGSHRVRHDWSDLLSSSSSMVSPVVMYGCESWTRKKVAHQRINAFELWCWRRLLRVYKEIKEVNPKGSQPWIFIGRTDDEAEAPILWPFDVKSQLIGKDSNAGKDWEQEEKGMTEWDGWMVSPTQWSWVWANSERQWRTGKLGVLQSMLSQTAGHDLLTEQQIISKLQGEALTSPILHLSLLSHKLRILALNDKENDRHRMPIIACLFIPLFTHRVLRIAILILSSPIWLLDVVNILFSWLPPFFYDTRSPLSEHVASSYHLLGFHSHWDLIIEVTIWSPQCLYQHLRVILVFWSHFLRKYQKRAHEWWYQFLCAFLYLKVSLFDY